MFSGKNVWILLCFFFLIALFIRFLYFPGNIYFGYDQARDAFATEEILHGHLKIIGPTTSFEGLNHGVLYYYLYAPFYFFGKGDPAFIAAFLRVLNSACVFIIFLLSTVLFNKYVGLISAGIFAISFEQTQFAMYLNHPSFAVASVLFMYLGLSYFIFHKKSLGLIIASLGLSLSIQFEFLLTYLIPVFLLILICFRSFFKKASKTAIFISAFSFIFGISTYLIAEIKYGFRSFGYLLQLFSQNSDKSILKIANFYLFEIGQMIRFNLIGSLPLKILTGLILLLCFAKLLKSKFKKQIIFLGLWFFSVIIIYIVTGGADTTSGIIQYHPNLGISLSLIIFVSFLIYTLAQKNKIVAFLFILFISAGNISLIKEYNPSGSIAEINAQSYMLLSDEKKVVDFIYQDTKGKPFALKGITMPFFINTTWSYLFSWYGLSRYGYTPVWGGKNALGYPNNLIVENAQDKLPDRRYLITEPLRGIPTFLIDDYLREESYFTDIEKEVNIGKFKVQIRNRKYAKINSRI